MIEALISLIRFLVDAYFIVIIAGIIFSWVRISRDNFLFQITEKLTEPVYDKVRSIIPTQFGVLDLAPFAVMLGLRFVQWIIISILYKFL